MSQWTHIRGCLELRGTPYEIVDVEGEDRPQLVLPFPREQVVLDAPQPGFPHTDEDGNTTRDLVFSLSVWSLPRCKPIVDFAAKEFLPYGECGFDYSLSQTRMQCWMSGSPFHSADTEKEFQRQICEMYREPYGHVWEFEKLEKWYDIKPGSESSVTGMLFAVREDIRYCSGIRMMHSLEKFVDYLREHDIEIEDGYLEWEDEYDPQHIYVLKSSRLWSRRSYSFMVLGARSNKPIARKDVYLEHEYNEETQRWEACVHITETPNWKHLVPDPTPEKEEE